VTRHVSQRLQRRRSECQLAMRTSDHPMRTSDHAMMPIQYIFRTTQLERLGLRIFARSKGFNIISKFSTMERPEHCTAPTLKSDRNGLAFIVDKKPKSNDPCLPWLLIGHMDRCVLLITINLIKSRNHRNEPGKHQSVIPYHHEVYCDVRSTPFRIRRPRI
jgi:hypothetical protein